MNVYCVYLLIIIIIGILSLDRQFIRVCVLQGNELTLLYIWLIHYIIVQQKHNIIYGVLIHKTKAYNHVSLYPMEIKIFTGNLC